MDKLTTTHKLNIALSFFAFALFVVNQFFALSGGALDLHGPWGALLLTGFLAAGILVQFAKIIEGHRTVAELIFTALLLIAHVAAELTIWITTQITRQPLPEALPLYIVGLYWVIGGVDIVVLSWRRNAAMVRGRFKSREELERELLLAEQAQRHAVEIAERTQSDGTANAERRQYKGTCPLCKQEMQSSSARGVQNAMNAHRRWCPGAPVESKNGHKKEELIES